MVQGSGSGQVDTSVSDNRTKTQSPTARGVFVPGSGFAEDHGVFLASDFAGYEASLTISACTITGNQGWGILVDRGFLAAEGNDLTSNRSGAVRNIQTAAIDCRYNWWGATDGPGGDFLGSGEIARGAMDVEPWLESAPGAIKLTDVSVGPGAFPAPTMPGGQVVNFAAQIRFVDPVTGDTNLPETPQWSVTITDTNGQQIAAQTGAGTSIQWWWDGFTSMGAPVGDNPPQQFSYRISASITGHTTAPAFGTLMADFTAPVATLIAPASNDVVVADANSGTLQFTGEAYGGGFVSYEVFVRNHVAEFVSVGGPQLIAVGPQPGGGSLATWDPFASAFVYGSDHPEVTARLEVTTATGLVRTESKFRLFFAKRRHAPGKRYTIASPANSVRLPIGFHLSLDSNWTLEIADVATGTPVRSVAGVGQEVVFAWDGAGDDSQPVPDGHYEVRVRATESESGFARALVSEADPIDVDRTPPIVSFSTPMNGATVSNDITVGASAIDNLDPAPSLMVSVQRTGESTWTELDGLVWDTNYFANGGYTLRAESSDAAGNQASTTISVTVSNLLDVTGFSISDQVLDGADTAVITYVLVADADVTVSLRQVNEILQDEVVVREWNFTGLTAGSHQVTWDGTNVAGFRLPPAEYRVVVTATAGSTTSVFGLLRDLQGPVEANLEMLDDAGNVVSNEAGGMDFMGGGPLKFRVNTNVPARVEVRLPNPSGSTAERGLLTPRGGITQSPQTTLMNYTYQMTQSPAEFSYSNITSRGDIIAGRGGFSSSAGAAGFGTNPDPLSGAPRQVMESGAALAGNLGVGPGGGQSQEFGSGGTPQGGSQATLSASENPKLSGSTSPALMTGARSSGGAPVGGVRLHKAGILTSDPVPTYIPANGLGWEVLEITVKTIDRNSIYLRGSEIPVEGTVFPKVFLPRHAEIATLILENTGVDDVSATVTVLEGKVYTDPSYAAAAAAPPVVQTLITAGVVTAGSTLDVEWDGRWDDGKLAVPGPYVIKVELTRGSDTQTFFHKVLVH